MQNKKIPKKVIQVIQSMNKELLKFLYFQIKSGKFPLKNYYGEAYTAAAFSLAKKNLELIPKIINKYQAKNKKGIDVSWEFNNLALQHVNKKYYKKIDSIIYPLYFNMPFYRKVTNWMLLRSLVYLNSNKKLNFFKGLFISFFVLLFQQRKGTLYDNRLYRKKEYSEQYHSFATLLLGEIAFKTKSVFIFRRYKQALYKLVEIIKNLEGFNSSGRGANQIFGPTSAIYALIFGGIKLNDFSLIDLALKLIKSLKKFQRKDGSFPLVLSKKEFKIPYKNYKNNFSFEGWESYNAYFDYMGFSAFYLQKTINFLKENM